MNVEHGSLMRRTIKVCSSARLVNYESMRPSDPAPIPINVRRAPNSDRIYCGAANDAKCQTRTRALQQSAPTFMALTCSVEGAVNSIKSRPASASAVVLVLVDTEMDKPLPEVFSPIKLGNGAKAMLQH